MWTMLQNICSTTSETSRTSLWKHSWLQCYLTITLWNVVYCTAEWQVFLQKNNVTCPWGLVNLLERRTYYLCSVQKRFPSATVNDSWHFWPLHIKTVKTGAMLYCDKAFWETKGNESQHIAKVICTPLDRMFRSVQNGLQWEKQSPGQLYMFFKASGVNKRDRKV